MAQIIYVNLADLRLPEFQSHSNTPGNEISDLAQSIKSLGVIEPLIVRDTDKGLEIVAGCLRYHASILAGLKAVPCINMTLDPQAAEILKLHENIKRIPLDHIDQGNTFLMMIETFGMTEKDIADRSGMSISYISQHISLVRLKNELTQAVKNRSISFSQARELMRVDDVDERNRLLRYCQHDGATVQVLKSWVQEYLRTKSISAPPDDSVPSLKYEYENPQTSRQCEACGKHVEISHIRQLFLCPPCCQAIKNAISEEKLKHS